MYYGLQFDSGGEAMQVVIDTATLRAFARRATAGVYGEWRFICGPGGDDSLEAAKAKVAETAYRLASPIHIQFTGDVVGSVSFDGSQNVSAALSLAPSTGGDELARLVNSLVASAIQSNDSVLTQTVRQMIDNAISYHVNKSGWHVSQDRGNN